MSRSRCASPTSKARSRSTAGCSARSRPNKVNQPHATDFSILARIAHLGITPGQDFAAAHFDATQIAEIQSGANAALEAILTGLSGLGRHANGWTTIASSIGVYGNDYFPRAVIAAGGLGANPPEDAIYPVLLTDADGEPVVGQRDYVLHFDADRLPPAAAFWSVTMYDAEGFQVANALDRYALGDRDPLTYNADGSLDLYLQHRDPGTDKQANWLPTPAEGALGVTMRLYAPAPEALDGRWNPPAVRRVPA